MMTAASMTLADIRLRVAMRAQKIMQDATGAMAADTTEPVASQIDQAIRDGIDSFWSDHDWSFASQFVQFDIDPDGTAMSIDGDAGRYLLPDLVRSQPLNPRVFIRGSDGGGGMPPIPVVSMDQVVERQFLEPDTSGVPIACAVEWSSTLRPGMSQRGGLEFRVFPDPGDRYTVSFRALVGAVPLVQETQRGNWPAAHDLSIVAFAVRELFRHDQKADSPARKVAEAEAAEALARSTRHDNEFYKAATLGSMADQATTRGRVVEFVDLTNGNTILSVTTFS